MGGLAKILQSIDVIADCFDVAADCDALLIVIDELMYCWLHSFDVIPVNDELM